MTADVMSTGAVDRRIAACGAAERLMLLASLVHAGARGRLATGGRKQRGTIWLALDLLMALLLIGSHSAVVDVAADQTWEWQPYSQGLPTYAMVVTLAVQPSDPSLLYAGTYEPPGLWRSDDRGRSWETDDLGLGGSPIYALHWDALRQRWWVGARDGLYTRPEATSHWEPSGRRGHAVYAIAEDGTGQLYWAGEGGLSRSSDGQRWESLAIPFDQPRTAILSLAVTRDGRTLLAGTAGEGLWISRDGGADWSAAAACAAETGGALGQAYVSAVLVDQAEVGTIYASTSESAYRSEDVGATWARLVGLEGRVHGFAGGADGGIYAALAGQVARSSDGGRTWEIDGQGLRAGDKVLEVAVSPDGPALVYVAAWDGVYASSDGGRSWERRSNGLGHSDVNVLEWDGAGDLLAGTRSGLYRKARSEAAWSAVLCSDGRAVLALVDAGNGSDFYAGLSGGLARSADGGRTWSEVRSEMTDDALAGLVVDPADTDHLYAWVAFGRVHESWDGGLSWEARWEGLGDVRPVSALYGGADGQLFAGAEDGLFRWEQSAARWQWLPLPLHAPTVFGVACAAGDKRTIYAGATDGIWHSPDGGTTWARWGRGLQGVTVTVVSISPTDARIAFAGTRHAGLYSTVDAGTTWRPIWTDDLATASVRDILFSGDGATIYVASDRGIWRGALHGEP
jgi:photosystem II stability/assembly factor-like uncharacterized protein